MKKKLETEQIIDALVAAMSEGASTRQVHVYRETLRSLVRLAKSEQIVDIKENVKKLTGALDVARARRRAKAVLLAQRLPGILVNAQQQLEFN